MHSYINLQNIRKVIQTNLLAVYVNVKDHILSPKLFCQWKQFKVALPVELGLFPLRIFELCGSVTYPISKLNEKLSWKGVIDGNRSCYRLVAWSTNMSITAKIV